MIGRMKFEIDALVAEILDRLPEEVWTSSTTTFMDPAIGGGQFVRAIEQRLRDHGHSDENISKRVWGFEGSQLNIAFAKSKLKLLGRYSCIPQDEFFESDIGMKFDIIVGNPPYNPPAIENRGGSGSGNKIWQKFIEKAFDAISENGIVAMVTPTNWRHGNFNKNRQHKKAQEGIFKHGILDWSDAKKHFPMVGHSIGIDWWISSKEGKTNIETNPSMLLARCNDDSMQLLNEWIESLNGECYVQDVGLNDCRKFNFHRGPQSNSSCKFKHLVSGSKTRNATFDWYDTKTQGLDNPKVMIHDSSGPEPFYDVMGEFGCGTHCVAYTVKSDAEAQSIMSFFSSKLCDWLVHQVSEKNAIAFPTFMFKRIPKNWRELEEKHFG